MNNVNLPFSSTPPSRKASRSTLTTIKLPFFPSLSQPFPTYSITLPPLILLLFGIRTLVINAFFYALNLCYSLTYFGLHSPHYFFCNMGKKLLFFFSILKTPRL